MVIAFIFPVSVLWCYAWWKRKTLEIGGNARDGRLSGKDYCLFDSSKEISGNLKVFNSHN
jgi:hypothetical protein